MIYGLDQNIFQSPISLILSIFLSLGVFNLGTLIQKLVIEKFKIINSKVNIFFSPIIGIYVLLYFLYLIFIFELGAIFFTKFTAYVLLFLGFIELFNIKKKIIKINYKNFENRLSFSSLVLLVILLFFISSSPITHADSLDYHFLGALNLIKLGHFHKEIIPMHLNLVSLGEIIIALGLSIKAEQFGGIVQFLSLLSLIPFFINKKKNVIFLILILICPITFFLVSSPKPQLLFCVSTFLIFVFLTEKVNKLRISELKIIFPLVILILSINSLTKYSFFLSSMLLGIYFLFIMLRKKLFFFSIISILIIIFITFLPSWLFRFENFDTNFSNLIKSSLPLNIYGYNDLHNLLSSGSLKVFGIFFPLSLQEFSTSYGPLLLFLPFLCDKQILKYKHPILIISLFIFFVFLFGGNLPRFLYEGYLWLIYLISKNTKHNSYNFKIFSKIVYFQMIIIIPIYLFYVFNLFPGSLNQKFKKTVMINNANGYELANWTNEKLNKDDILLTTHRSISLFKIQTLSSNFTRHIEPDDQRSIIYFDSLKSKKVNKILFYGKRLEKGIFENCLGKEVFFKKNVGRHVGRNPYSEKEYYNGWIYEFDYSKLPNCLSRNF